ncbi:DUF6148 family protein [Niameybacter massiliensis]|uniref:DUF6148 family protein n=1 Tax=Holtiella tumoricola TaxID=3018743 RepID=A0AA42J1M0_9FIRM|nr:MULTISPECIES: DUF6148 family protein [Lachnospirales]MDA3732378.1 DUF6148 family protein [Holtiella tumoricola]
MAAWTLEQARTHLNAWLEAELTVTSGQEYTIGSRRLTRANLKEIREQIVFWKNEVEKIEVSSKKKARNRIYRIVPLD